MEKVILIGVATFGMLMSHNAFPAGQYVEVGDIITANYLGNKVVKFNPITGSQQTLGTFTAPMDIAMSTGGDLYVGELGGAIKRLSIAEGTITILNPASALTSVRGLVIGPNGNLYATGRSGSLDVVMQIDPVSGTEAILTQSDKLSLPTGIEFLDDNSLVVASFLNNAIVKIDLITGKQSVIAQGGVWIDHPWGLAVFGNQVYSGHYDSKQINSVTPDTGIITKVGIVPGFPYGFAVEPTGNLLIGAAASAPGQNDMLIRVSPEGSIVANFDAGPRQQISGIVVSTVRVGTPPTNSPPQIDPVPDQTVNEGSLVTFRVTATDPDSPPQVVTFTLDPGAPPGATISQDGRFSWTPNEIHGPGTYQIAIRGTDNGVPPLYGSVTVNIVVREVNLPPTLDHIGDDVLRPGQTVSVALHASDPDLPAQTLTFALEQGPPGSSVSPDGQFSWTPGPEQAGTSHTVTVTVSDSFVPALTSKQSFTVNVLAPVMVEVGDIFAADFDANAVFRIDAKSGDQVVLGSFDGPTDVSFCTNGSLYVCEWSGVVKRLDLATGEITLVSQSTLLSELWGVVAAPDGTIFVTSADQNSIVRIAPETGEATVLTQDGLLFGPHGIDFLDANHLIVSSMYNNKLVAVSLADGSQTALAEEEGLDLPWGVVASDSGPYVANYGSHIILRAANGALEPFYQFDQNAPACLAIDGNGQVFVAVHDPTGAQVLRLSSEGVLLQTYAGAEMTSVMGLEISPIRIVVGDPSMVPAPTLHVTRTDNNFYRVSFEGVPGVTYRLQHSDALGPALWETLASVKASELGIAEYIDIQINTGSNRFYRAIYP
ncbi:MAG TPA: Ig-like domain-containing protein [Verrucomicrobiota bacterium]|nr:Ig-like domain-containing protein [Verrucomicrobiota bacterium]